MRKQQKNVLKMPRFLCFFKLLLDWDAVETHGRQERERAEGERAGMQIVCAVIKKKEDLGNIYTELFTHRTVGEQ